MQQPGQASRIFIAVLAICASGTVRAEVGERHGKALLETLCARCHAVGRTGRSPNALAPPFRTFGDDKLYDNDFAQRLQDGLSSIHPAMPTFHFSRDDAESAVAYLRAIQDRKLRR